MMSGTAAILRFLSLTVLLDNTIRTQVFAECDKKRIFFKIMQSLSKGPLVSQSVIFTLYV